MRLRSVAVGPCLLFATVDANNPVSRRWVPNRETPMDELFDVQMDDPSHNPTSGSCINLFRPRNRDPGHAYPDKQLNQLWLQSHLLLHAAGGVYQLAESGDKESQALLAAFFGINFPVQSGSMDEQRMSVVKNSLVDMGKIAFSVRTNANQRSLFLCGSKWLEYLSLDDKIDLDAHGQIVIPQHGHLAKSVAVREYVTSSGRLRNPDDYWWFRATFADVPPQLINLPKSRYPAIKDQKIPFLPNPERDNKPDPCYNTINVGLNAHFKTANGVRRLLMLCTSAMPFQSSQIERLDTTAVEGTKLQDKSSHAMTLFRLLLEYSDLQLKLGRKPAVTPRSGVNEDQEWYKSRENFVVEISTIAETVDQVRMLAIYDRSSPQAKRVQDQLTVHNLDNYVWFAVAAWLHSETHFDWSSGVARPVAGQDRLKAGKLHALSEPKPDDTLY